MPAFVGSTSEDTGCRMFKIGGMGALMTDTNWDAGTTAGVPEKLAVTLARLRAVWRGRKRVEYKGPVDLVTATDREIEALIVARLREAFPDHLIVAEEASAGTTPPRPAVGQYAWYLDPLDGTMNFAHAYPQFCVSLAVARGAALLFGIVYDPVHEETFVASRGRGAPPGSAPRIRRGLTMRRARTYR